MAISIETVADKTYNLLKGYGFKIDTFNKVGEVVGDPSEAIRFFVEDPNGNVLEIKTMSNPEVLFETAS